MRPATKLSQVIAERLSVGEIADEVRGAAIKARGGSGI